MCLLTDIDKYCTENLNNSFPICQNHKFVPAKLPHIVIFCKILLNFSNFFKTVIIFVIK